MKTIKVNIFKNKTILVTGGTGSIGSEIVRQLLVYKPKQIRIYSRDEWKHFVLEQELKSINSDVNVKFLIGDIRDINRLNEAMTDVDIVFHAAGIKHLTYAEDNPYEAIKTNVIGTQNLVDTCLSHNVERVIAISTDKAVYPHCIMGTTKHLMERLIIGNHHFFTHAKTIFSVVRFGNVLNSRGSVIPTWVEQIMKGDSITITNPLMNRYFLSIPEAVSLVFSAARLAIGSEIFVLKMPKINIGDLAKETIEKYGCGKNISIKIIGSHEREKVDESLFTDEEIKLIVEEKELYIVLPNQIIFDERKDSYKSN